MQLDSVDTFSQITRRCFSIICSSYTHFLRLGFCNYFLSRIIYYNFSSYPLSVIKIGQQAQSLIQYFVGPFKYFINKTNDFLKTLFYHKSSI